MVGSELGAWLLDPAPVQTLVDAKPLPAFNIVWLMCRHFSLRPASVNALPSGIFFDFVHAVICNPFESVWSARRAHGGRVTIA
jgi:hypothetical protein